MAKNRRVSFWGDENDPKLNVEMCARTCFRWVDCMEVNYTAIKFLFKTPPPLPHEIAVAFV